jgi:hypothetical protein
MTATAMTAEVTGAIRDLGTGLQARGRSLGSSAHVLGWMASVLAAHAPFLHAGTSRLPGTVPVEWAIVDRELTRC